MSITFAKPLAGKMAKPKESSLFKAVIKLVL